MAFPWLIPRAVLPTQWIKNSGFYGGSTYNINSTFSKSTPLAITSVVQRIPFSATINS